MSAKVKKSKEAKSPANKSEVQTDGSLAVEQSLDSLATFFLFEFEEQGLRKLAGDLKRTGKATLCLRGKEQEGYVSSVHIVIHPLQRGRNKEKRLFRVIE